MMFSIGKDGFSISRVQSKWSPRELDIENFLMNGPGFEDGLLNEAILGEELLLVSNQVRTRDKKRADILALDRQGSGVIIELKRDQAMAGVETQALQYLAAFSSLRGVDFTQKFGTDPRVLQERIKRFLGDVPIEHVNRRHRIILVARSFDRTLFSMGKWFGSNGVAFRCIAYTPFEVERQRFISFSVAFDHSPPETFPLAFGSQAREPTTFWHNIGAPDESWWAYLRKKGEIPASWDNEPGDEGEQLLKSYVRGDRIVAYAKGFGAVGWGQIEQPNYRLVDLGSTDDRRGGELRHRLSILWKAVSPKLKQGIAPAEIRNVFGLYHPLSTSVELNATKAEPLIEAMTSRFE